MLFFKSCFATPGAGLAIFMVCRRTWRCGRPLGFTLSSEPPANLTATTILIHLSPSPPFHQHKITLQLPKSFGKEPKKRTTGVCFYCADEDLQAVAGRKGVRGPFPPGRVYLRAKASAVAVRCSATHTSSTKEMQKAAQSGDTMSAQSQGKTEVRKTFSGVMREPGAGRQQAAAVELLRGSNQGVSP